MQRKKFTKTQQKFTQRFFDMLYYSMEIEGEAPYFPEGHEELPSTPERRRWVQELRTVQFAWRDEVFRAAGITTRNWDAFREYQLGSSDKDDDEDGEA